MKPTPIDPYAAQGKNRAMWAVVAGLVLVLLLGLGFGGARLLGFGARDGGVLATGFDAPGAALSQEAPVPAPALVQPATPPPAVLPQTATPPPAELQQTGMPQEIIDWLEHLRRCEEARNRLTQDRLAQLLVTFASLKIAGGSIDALQGLMAEDGNLPETTPAQDLGKHGQVIRQEMSQLRDYFNSYPPPAECMTIAADYNRVLGETSRMIGDIIAALDASSQDPQAAISALSSMRGTSDRRIGDAARKTDAGVAAVCSRYQVRKWFSISDDIGGGALAKLGGFGF